MPALSIFTPLGLLKLTKKPSPAELFYKQQIAALGGQFNVEQGTHVEASVYARAMGHGRAHVALERAGNQAYPATTLELLPTRETEYGLVPGPADTILDRQNALAAARRLPRGGALVHLNDAFATLLGDDFLGVRPTPSDEAVNEPTSLGDQPMNLQLATVDRKFIRLLEPITGVLPLSTSMQYEPLDPALEAQNENHRIFVGDTLVIDSENSTRTERVVVTARGTGEQYFTFTATFTKPHASGVTGTTIPFPQWPSSKRHYLVVLTEAAAADAEKRRKANELAARVFAGVCTWSVCGGEEAGGVVTAGPFRVGEGMLGITPIGTCVV